MTIETSKMISIFGVILAVIEIWRPRLSVLLESLIDNKIEKIELIKNEFVKEFRVLSGVANSTLKEVAKGPQWITPEELKAITITSIENIKTYICFYAATIILATALIPLKNIFILLNKIGKGRAVGGIGIVLGLIGVLI